MFDRSVDANGMRTNDSKETVRAFSTMLTKKNPPENFGVDKGTEFAGEFEKLCKADGIRIYSTMSDTMAAFAERTNGPWKKYFTVTWKTMDTSTFTIWLNSLQH